MPLGEPVAVRVGAVLAEVAALGAELLRLSQRLEFADGLLVPLSLAGDDGVSGGGSVGRVVVVPLLGNPAL